MRSKYIPGMSMDELYRMPRTTSKNGSIVWKALVATFPQDGNWTIWKIGNGSKVRIGEDPCG
jgi:hypothetical protein